MPDKLITRLKRKADLITTNDDITSDDDIILVARKIFFYHYGDEYEIKGLKLYSTKEFSHKKYPNIKVSPHFLRDDGVIIYINISYNNKIISEISDETIQIAMNILNIKKTILATIDLDVPMNELDNDFGSHNITCKDIEYFPEIAKQYIISCTRKKFKKSPKTKSIKKLEGFNPSEWVSATKTKNYVLNDPLIDWLEFSESKKIGPINDTIMIDVEDKSDDNKNDYSEENPEQFNTNNFDSYVRNKGIEFENKVINLIKKMIPAKDFVTICCDMNNYHQRVMEYEKNTIKEIMKGTPIIYQGVLLNRTGKLMGSYGIPDLIVRSDYLSQIFAKKVVYENNFYEKAPKLSGDYHYVVVDIKFSTLELCFDGKRIRNSGYYPAYKCQLYIYNHALGLIQGYEPETSYILGRKYRYTIQNKVNRGNNCFESIGHIEYDGWDKHYIKKTIKAIKWLMKLRDHGKEWKLFPKPSVKELYPNMCNILDTKWSEFKNYYAKKIGEISLLWNCGVKHRRIAHKNKIYHIRDKRCNSANLGINGLIQGPLLNSIIHINKRKEFESPMDRISIGLDKYDFDIDLMTGANIRITVDFETIGCVFDDFKNLPYASDINYLFMIGVAYRIGSESPKYKMFLLSELSIKAEFQLIYQFYLFIKKLIDDNVKEGDFIPPLCHYGHFEKTLFTTLCAKLKREIGKDIHADIEAMQEYISWFDLAKFLKKHHVVVNGCYKFGLKEIAGQLYNLGLIKTKWPKGGGPDKGITAMIMAYNAYQQLNECPINKSPIMYSIMEYNKVDCLVIHEIMDLIGQKIAGKGMSVGNFDDIIDDSMIIDV